MNSSQGARGVASASRAAWLWGPPVGLMAAIFVVSSMPSVPAPPGLLTDKHLHFGAYAVLAALVYRALAGATLEGLTTTRAIAAASVATLYGATDEWHQSFVPGRTADVADLVADAAGAVVGVGLLRAWSIIGRFRREIAARRPRG